MKLLVRYLPTVSFNRSYAVELPDGKIVHYTHNFNPEMSVKQFDDALVVKLNEDYEDVTEIEFAAMASPDLTTGETYKTLPIADDVFDKNTRKALKKMKKNQYNIPLVQTDEYVYVPNWLGGLVDRFTGKINSIIRFVEDKMHQKTINGYLKSKGILKRSSGMLILPEAEFDDDKYWELMEIVNKELLGIKTLLPRIPRLPWIRYVNFMVTFAIMCGEEDLAKAAEALSNDLNLLHSKELILGSLSMPKIMELANMVGNGKKVYAVFAMPIVNFKKTQKLGFNPPTSPDIQTFLNETIGTKYATYEGAISNLDGKQPYQDLIIGQVDFGANLTKNAYEEAAKAYQEGQEKMHRIAVRRKEAIEAAKAAREKSKTNTDNSNG